MDIRCPSCSTLYEFEEDKIGPKGVNVRCSACGQVFKVRKAAAPPVQKWVVKRESTGETIDFDHLSTLQRWIVEQKVSRRDLISKTGDTWRSLGSIKELAAFFKVVDELNEPRGASRETAGYLTASQQTPREQAEARGAAGFAPQPVDPHRRGRGFTPTPDETRPVSASRKPDRFADSSLPDVRPASESAPEHAVNRGVLDASAASPLTKHQERINSQPTPIVESDEDGGNGYSLGKDDFWDEAPAISFAAPAIDDGRSSDYTAEYSDLRRERRRWPTILLALLMLLAGTLVIIAALQPSWLGFGSDPAALSPVDSGIVETDPGETEPVAEDSAESSGDSEGSGTGVAAGSGESDGSGEGAEADDGVEVGGDTGTQVAAIELDGAEPESPQVDTAPEPEPARDTETTARAEPRREARRPEPDEPEAPSGYDGLMGAGNTSLRAGDYEEALNYFSNATDARPNSAEAHVGVARSYEAMGRHDLAAVRYERATNVNSRYTPAWLGLGEARRRSGDTGGACEAYDRVLSIVRTGRSAERARRGNEELGCE